MQSNGQTSTQTPHPLQLSGWTTAIGRSWRLSTLVTFPKVSRMASSGQITPHAPQSMQRVASIRNAFLGSPLIARVGQRFSQAVQPVQFSATIVKGMSRRYQTGRARTNFRALALHLLQDLVLTPLVSQPIVAEGLLEAEPREEEHEEHHEHDRDVVRLREDVDELPEGLHARPVPRAVVTVNAGEHYLHAPDASR